MLKINRNVEIAIKAVEALARTTKPVRVSDLAAQIGTTENFLEQIVRRLRLGGITRSVRGPGGGVALVTGQKISALQIADALGYEVPFGNAMGDMAERVRSRVHGVLNELTITV